MSETVEIEDSFVIQDSMALIRDTCKSVKVEMGAKYIAKKKVSPEYLDDYFAVIEQTMVSHFLGEDGDYSAMYERLKAVRPKLTRGEYYRKHRAVVEYLARLTRERVGERLKKSV